MSDPNLSQIKQLEAAFHEMDALLGKVLHIQFGIQDEEWLEVRRDCETEMRGTAPILRIRPLLCQLTGLTPSVLGSIIEYIQFPLLNIDGEPIDISPIMDDLQFRQPATKHLGIQWSEVGDGRLLRVWDTNGSFAFSVEPTASCSDADPMKHRWLFFCHLR